jgi:hypothetical protein
MRPLVRSAYAAILAIGIATSPAIIRADEAQELAGAQMAQAYPPDCVCRAQGRTFAVGESVCLRTATGPRVAFCGMVLNNTSWELTERSCPES